MGIWILKRAIQGRANSRRFSRDFYSKHGIRGGANTSSFSSHQYSQAQHPSIGVIVRDSVGFTLTIMASEN